MSDGSFDKKLEQEWIMRCNQWLFAEAKHGNRKVVAECFADLCQRYNADNRHYHSVEHIVSMLDMARQNMSLIQDWDSVYFAIWFHDAVQGLGVDGESASAQLCATWLGRIEAPESVIAAAKGMILATKNHPFYAQGDLALFLDLDLAILGAPWPQYLNYTQNNRKEYPVPDWLYRRGRRQFLKAQLSKPRLFNSAYFAKQFEDKARQNLQQELLIL